MTDGSTYEGDFREGLKQRRGVFTWPDNSYYEGEFDKDCMSGLGKFVSL